MSSRAITAPAERRDPVPIQWPAPYDAQRSPTSGFVVIITISPLSATSSRAATKQAPSGRTLGALPVWRCAER